MIEYEVHVRPSSEDFPRYEQLAWHLAEVAVDSVDVEPAVTEMVINRIIDNAAVAAAALRRHPVMVAREQALPHHLSEGASLFGFGGRGGISPEWAAWANGVAVRELDFHDTFLAAEYSHPGDNIPPILAVAQHRGSTGRELITAIVTGYEIQVDLARAISLHVHRIDHIAHLGPSVAAGVGTLLGLDTEVIYQAIGQSLHVTTQTRQSRKGDISSWKAFAPAFAGKAAIEAVDRAMRGERSPAPIYEGEDGVIAWLLDGPSASYTVVLPEAGEPKRAILDTYTKEYSAEYQAQALIDLAKRLRSRIEDLAAIEKITISTSYHTHSVIGSGAGDPQKFDPLASRETLDHSAMYLFAVALEDGGIDHESSYTRERASRASTIDLWRRIETVEDPEWTRRYHSNDLSEKAFGGAVVIRLADGTTIHDELALADAHPGGARPFGRAQYVEKFRKLADGVVAKEEQTRFLERVEGLETATAEEVRQLGYLVPELEQGASSVGLF